VLRLPCEQKGGEGSGKGDVGKGKGRSKKKQKKPTTHSVRRVELLMDGRRAVKKKVQKSKKREGHPG